jgi:hypothetical protein
MRIRNPLDQILEGICLLNGQEGGSKISKRCRGSYQVRRKLAASHDKKSEVFSMKKKCLMLVKPV